MSQLSDALLESFSLYDKALTELDAASREPHDSPWHAAHLQAFGSLQDDALALAQGVGCADLEFLRLYADYRA